LIGITTLHKIIAGYLWLQDCDSGRLGTSLTVQHTVGPLFQSELCIIHIVLSICMNVISFKLYFLKFKKQSQICQTQQLKLN